MRFSRGDVRDHIVSSKIDHGLPLWRRKAAQREKSKDQLSRDFWGLFDFRLLQQYPHYERTSIRRSVSCEFVEPVQSDLPCPVPSAKFLAMPVGQIISTSWRVQSRKRGV